MVKGMKQARKQMLHRIFWIQRILLKKGSHGVAVGLSWEVSRRERGRGKGEEKGEGKEEARRRWISGRRIHIGGCINKSDDEDNSASFPRKEQGSSESDGDEESTKSWREMLVAEAKNMQMAAMPNMSIEDVSIKCFA
eukprot:757759-Hanusia_phi.AAC.1